MFSTEQKDLAMQMWEEVKDWIEEDRYFDVEFFKMSFCKKHNIKWKCNCILCAEYYGSHCSSECPLMRKAMKEYGDEMEEQGISCGCSNKIPSDYAIALDLDQHYNRGSYTLEERQKAIDNIIKAIEEA